MTRTSMKLWLIAIVAALALGAPAEAAGKKSVRHRTKHSSRVTTGASATTNSAHANSHAQTNLSRKSKPTKKAVKAPSTIKKQARPATKAR